MGGGKKDLRRKISKDRIEFWFFKFYPLTFITWFICMFIPRKLCKQLISITKSTKKKKKTANATESQGKSVVLIYRTFYSEKKTRQVYLVCSTFGSTLISKCYEYSLQLFHMDRPPWGKIFPSICDSSQVIVGSYQLYKLLKSQLKFKFALPPTKKSALDRLNTTMFVVWWQHPY